MKRGRFTLHKVLFYVRVNFSNEMMSKYSLQSEEFEWYLGTSCW